MLAEVIGDSIRCPHCLSSDARRFALERKVLWREPIRETFRDRGRLVLIAECDQPLIDMAGSEDQLYCEACGNRSLIDVTAIVHHEDPKI
jgi:DNA-directed RNA polymerase subunit RPC12/RpoP